MKPDYDEYLPYFDESDMSDEKKRECIDSMYLIVKSFVDLAWRKETDVRMVKEFCDAEQEKKVKTSK